MMSEILETSANCGWKKVDSSLKMAEEGRTVVGGNRWWLAMEIVPKLTDGPNLG